MEDLIKNFIDFHKKSEKLKTTMRHSWLSDLSQESTAEHSWMLCLLAILLFDKLDKKVDLLKVLKILTVHDLAESVNGDIPSHEVSIRQQTKQKDEMKALKSLVKNLPKIKVNEIISLVCEFDENKTRESKFANSLDKLEAVMQHNISDIAKWDQGDFNVHPYYKNHFFDFDYFMRAFKDVVDGQSMKKIIKAEATHRIDKKHLEKYKNHGR